MYGSGARYTLMNETDSILIALESITLRSNSVKARVYNQIEGY